MTLVELVRYLPLVLAGLWSHSSLAECSIDLLNAVRASDVPYEQGYEACKRLPGADRTAIVAIAYAQDDPDDDYRLEVALVDESAWRVLARYAGTLTNGGGPDLGSIEIDTGRYRLSPETRAFGIRASYSMSEGFTWSKTLNLFVQDGSELRRVLADLNVEIMFYTPSAPPPHEVRSRHAIRNLQMTPKSRAGYFDIVVVETIADHDYVENLDGTRSDLLRREDTRRYNVRFNGKVYEVPKELWYFDCRFC